MAASAPGLQPTAKPGRRSRDVQTHVISASLVCCTLTIILPLAHPNPLLAQEFARAHMSEMRLPPMSLMHCGESRVGGGVSCFHDRFTVSLTALQKLTSLEGFQDLTHVQLFYFNHSLLHHSQRPTVSRANSPRPLLLLCRTLNPLLSLIPNKTR